jgi:hypothetical protein
MNSGKKILGLLLALAMVTAMGCSRNKQQQVPTYPAGTGYQSQPGVNAMAPSSTGTRSSSYIK